MYSNLIARRKGIIVHLGFMTFVLIAVIVYLLVATASPDTAQKAVIDPLGDLVRALKP